METLGFRYKVEAEVRLSREDFELLHTCSKVHYDSACRKFFMREGASWWPDPGQENVQVSVTRRELDRCLKILEGPPHDLAWVARHLAEKIRGVRDELERERSRLENVQETG